MVDVFPRKHVAIVYHFFPHYRAAILNALDKSHKYAFTFVGNTESYNGIRSVDSSKLRQFITTPIRQVGPLVWQSAVIRLSWTAEYEAMVFLGNPNFVSTWIAAAIARCRGTKVLFWTHGWLCREAALKRLLRRAFYKLAHVVLVYGERAKSLGIAEGYSKERIRVIYNSLDYSFAAGVRSSIENDNSEASSPYPFFSEHAHPVVICTARLTRACRFDLLIEAAAILKQNGSPINVLLVGDGPELVSLRHLADTLGVSIYFWGACYDEKILGRLLYHADLTVSPGKIGLTVIHSLTYGTPAITHGDMNAQMPEVEAIQEGATGLLFNRNDARHLAEKIKEWLDNAKDRAGVRSACIREVEMKWTPARQKELIEEVLDGLLQPIAGCPAV